ncbi:MAG: gliding motility lipoprotein GldH [Bacteroidales bacterium]|nr:gliding motility lipoprotein GldH [Bacteroidales bacterium]
MHSTIPGLKQYNGIRKGLFLAMIICVLLSLPSCDRSIFYEEMQHVEGTDWKESDTLFFKFEVTDTLQAYDLSFSVRNTTSYQFQNLYLFITAWYPDQTWSRDTAECILAASDGEWLGKGNGKIRDSQYLFRKGVKFRRSGKYTIGVNQAMRTESLAGVSDIGIRLEKSGK